MGQSYQIRLSDGVRQFNDFLAVIQFILSERRF